MTFSPSYCECIWISHTKKSNSLFRLAFLFSHSLQKLEFQWKNVKKWRKEPSSKISIFFAKLNGFWIVANEKIFYSFHLKKMKSSPSARVLLRNSYCNFSSRDFFFRSSFLRKLRFVIDKINSFEFVWAKKLFSSFIPFLPFSLL